MIQQMNEKRCLFLVLFLSFIFFISLGFFAETTFDVGDGIRHYLIARYSWNHPGLLLDSWGKPFFTLISSPFSQFGFYGATVFNIVCGVLSAYITYVIAKKLNYKNALLVVPFLLFAPIYFPTMNSGLTEPFFGLVFILSILLMVEKKFYAAAILISFLPFVRTEGFLFLPLFFVVLVYHKSFIPAMLLALGTVLYSIVGGFYFGDFLWIKNHNPYTGSNRDSYGSGELSSFADRYDFIWGTILSILLVAGILIFVFRIFFRKKDASDKRILSSIINIETTLILGCFVVFFAAHSFMWWKGLANSMGLVRVFAGVMPCTTLICLAGFNLLTPDILFKNKFVKGAVVSVLLFFIVLKPFKSEYFPFKLSQEQILVKEAAEWVKAEGHDKKYLFYLYPYLPLLLDIDAFDNKKVADLWALYPSIKKSGINNIPNGAIVFWDAHFGPNECGIPLDTIMNDPNFNLLKTFYPKERFTTLGENAFTISVFEKRKSAKSEEEISMKQLASLNFSNSNGVEVFDSKMEYGINQDNKLSDFPKGTERITFSANYLSEEASSDGTLIVLAVDDSVNSKNVYWESRPFAFSIDSTNVKKVSATFIISLSSLHPDYKMKIFVWNRNKKSFSMSENKIICNGRATN